MPIYFIIGYLYTYINAYIFYNRVFIYVIYLETETLGIYWYIYNRVFIYVNYLETETLGIYWYIYNRVFIYVNYLETETFRDLLTYICKSFPDENIKIFNKKVKSDEKSRNFRNRQKV